MSHLAEEGRPVVVVVIDDDQSVREALQGLFQSVGLITRCFGSVRAYLESDQLGGAGCVVLDIRLPGTSGLEFLETLPRSDIMQSVVLISAHVDVQMAVRAMKAGAVDVLTKPVREQDLLEAVNRALTQDKLRRDEADRCAFMRARYATLTERERQVMALVAAGGHHRSNRQTSSRPGDAQDGSGFGAGTGEDGGSFGRRAAEVVRSG
jgi:FixJ family two-component response regulator